MVESKVEITVQTFKRVDLVKVDGRIDASNSGLLDEKFNELADNGRYRLVLDTSGIEYMSSAGLRAMVSALRECKKHSGDVRVASPSKRMTEILSLAGLDSVFSIYDDPLSAVGSY